jgi:phenylacetate-CoA ligase
MTSDRPGRTLYPHVLGLVTPLAVERAVGAPYLSVADWLRTWTTWTDEDRAAWQQERLTATVAHAAQHVPYYRRRLGHRRPETVTLAELPVVDKATIRRDMDAFLSRGWRSIAHIDKQTGGTTGDPWRYPLDRAAWTHMYAANLHLWERTGYRYGERVVRLGAPEFLGRMRNSPKSQVRSWFERHDTTLTGFDIGPAASLRRALRAGRRPAALWYGYPFTLAAMAEAVLEHQPQIQRPRAVVTTGEMLEPSLLHSIRAAFGPRVYDQYG